MRYFVYAICAALMLALVAFSQSAAAAAFDGFSLWSKSVLPALLPFFVCASLMRAANPFGKGAFIPLAVSSLVSGAPSGARLCGEFFDSKSSARCASAYAASLNIISPMFISGVFCADMLIMPDIAAPLIISIYTSAALTFALVRIRFGKPAFCGVNNASGSMSLDAFARAVGEAMLSLLGICGTIMFFCVLIKLIELTGVFDTLLSMADPQTGAALECLFTGAFETVSGVRMLAEHASLFSPRVIVACAGFVFASGGLCIAAQSTAFMRLDLRVYVVTKLFSGTIAAGLAYLITPLFLPQTAPAMGGVITPADIVSGAPDALVIFVSSLLGVVTLYLAASAFGEMNAKCKK